MNSYFKRSTVILLTTACLILSMSFYGCYSRKFMKSFYKNLNSECSDIDRNKKYTETECFGSLLDSLSIRDTKLDSSVIHAMEAEMAIELLDDSLKQVYLDYYETQSRLKSAESEASYGKRKLLMQESSLQELKQQLKQMPKEHIIEKASVKEVNLDEAMRAAAYWNCPDSIWIDSLNSVLVSINFSDSSETQILEAEIYVNDVVSNQQVQIKRIKMVDIPSYATHLKVELTCPNENIRVKEDATNTEFAIESGRQYKWHFTIEGIRAGLSSIEALANWKLERIVINGEDTTHHDFNVDREILMRKNVYVAEQEIPWYVNLWNWIKKIIDEQASEAVAAVIGAGLGFFVQRMGFKKEEKTA